MLRVFFLGYTFKYVNLVAKHPRKFLSAFMTLLFLNFLHAVQHFSIAFVNSSYLATFFSTETISLIYILSSASLIVALFVLPSLVTRFGAWPLLLFIIPLLQLSIIFFGFAGTALVALVFFILRGMLGNSMRYLLDLYVESLSKDESHTGNTRSLYISAGVIGVLLGPVFASILVFGTNYQVLYAFSAMILAPMFFIVLSELRKFKPAVPKVGLFKESIQSLINCRKSVRNTMFVNMFFQMWTVIIGIYAPLYLVENGFSWQFIGSLIAVAQLPYLIMEIPLGIIADKYIGEKEMMIVGVITLGLFTTLLSIVPLTNIITWSIIFVLMRTGSAAIEISTESYFFKQVNEQDSALISIFRMLLPIGGIIGPLLVFLILPFVGLQWVFAVIGAVILLGVLFARRIVDTK